MKYLTLLLVVTMFMSCATQKEAKINYKAFDKELRKQKSKPYTKSRICFYDSECKSVTIHSHAYIKN